MSTTVVNPVPIDRVPEARLREVAQFIDQRAQNAIPVVKHFEQLNPSNAKSTGEQMRLHLFNAMRQCDQFKTEAQEKLEKLKAELKNAQDKSRETNTKIDTHESTVSSMKNQIFNLKNQFDQKAQERAQLVQTLDGQGLGHIIVIDQRDKSNHLFLWMLEAIYQEPISKYYWPNFNKEALQKDNASNLKERISHLKISGMTTSASEATEVLLAEKQAILEDMKNKGNNPVPAAIDQVFRIVENISQSRKLYVEYSDLEKKFKKLVDDHQYVTLEKKKYSDVQDTVSQRIEVLSKVAIYYNNYLQALLQQSNGMYDVNKVEHYVRKPDPTPANQGYNPVDQKTANYTSPDQVNFQNNNNTPAPVQGEEEKKDCMIF